MEINYDQLPLIAGLDGFNLNPKVQTETPARPKCPEFPYFGASYPDARCIDGRLYDLDNCDNNGDLYEPGEYAPCPFCRPKDFMESNDMTQEEYDEFMADLMRRGYE